MNSFWTLAAGLLTPKDIGVDDAVIREETAYASVLETAYIWAGIVCVIIIIIAGFIYVTSNGNATNIKRGKDAMMGAVIGLIVILFAFMITQFVIGRF